MSPWYLLLLPLALGLWLWYRSLGGWVWGYWGEKKWREDLRRVGISLHSKS